MGLEGSVSRRKRGGRDCTIEHHDHSLETANLVRGFFQPLRVHLVHLLQLPDVPDGVLNYRVLIQLYILLVGELPCLLDDSIQRVHARAQTLSPFLHLTEEKHNEHARSRGGTPSVISQTRTPGKYRSPALPRRQVTWAIVRAQRKQDFWSSCPHFSQDLMTSHKRWSREITASHFRSTKIPPLFVNRHAIGSSAG